MNKLKFKRLAATVCVFTLSASSMLFTTAFTLKQNETSLYSQKSAVLKDEVFNSEKAEGFGVDNSKNGIKQVVFIAVCDTKTKAEVFTGTGASLSEAWRIADTKASEYVKGSKINPEWIKAEVISESENISGNELEKRIADEREGFFRYGISFDGNFETAVTEGELNAADFFDYDECKTDLDNVNDCLKNSGRPTINNIPENCTVFKTNGWFCDENKVVYPLSDDSLSYGRRITDINNKDEILKIIKSSSDYLVNQLKEDGSFIYGYYPAKGTEINSYNMLRHAGTLWALVRSYKVVPSAELKTAIEKSAEYLVSQVVYRDEDTAYLLEKKADELKLGGAGLAVIALTEYREVFGNKKYDAVCQKLGNGILTMLDGKTGEYYHVYNADFTPKDKERTIFYDGEATYALCRLYGMDRDKKWYDAAMLTFDYFMKNNYEKDCSQWIEYSFNEITKYNPSPELYEFALRNFQKNVEKLHRETLGHTYFELCGTAFETWQRMKISGVTVKYDDFSPADLRETTQFRLERLMDNYFYPEYAMYMENPSVVLNSFFARTDDYRTRIDDTQHSLGGLYLYYTQYDEMYKK